MKKLLSITQKQMAKYFLIKQFSGIFFGLGFLAASMFTRYIDNLVLIIIGIIIQGIMLGEMMKGTSFLYADKYMDRLIAQEARAQLQSLVHGQKAKKVFRQRDG